jgi:peptide/nickel transport system substrate-binding protein
VAFLCFRVNVVSEPTIKGGVMKTSVGRNAVAIVVLTACTTLLATRSVQTAPRPAEWQRTLIIAVTADPQTFDPAVNVALISAYRFYPNIYEGLIQYAPDGKIIPMLADKWQILDNGLRYRFSLIRGATFSDGTPFDAAAVKFDFDRFLKLDKGLASTFSSVKSIDVVDNNTVDITLKEPYAPLLSVLASWYGAQIVSPTAVGSHDVNGDQGQAWLRDHTVGTGPYTLESWVPENRLILVQNPRYRFGWKPGQIERVVFTTVREPSTLRQALEGGDVDIAEQVPPSIIAPLRNAKGVNVNIRFSQAASWGQAMYLNLKKPPLDNVNVRKALAYAIDYKRLIDVWQGIGSYPTGPFPPTSRPWYAEQAVVQYRHDPTKAQEYLTKAGFGMPITAPLKFNLLWQSGATAQRDMAQLIAEDWGKLGIQLNIQETPLPVWREAIWQHTFDMAFVQENLRYNDPDAIASLEYPSTEYRYRGWNPGFNNPRVDRLVQLGRTTVNPTARVVFYTEFQHIVTDQVVILDLANILYAFANRSEVEGIVWNPNYGPHFRAYDIRKNPNAK